MKVLCNFLQNQLSPPKACPVDERVPLSLVMPEFKFQKGQVSVDLDHRESHFDTPKHALMRNFYYGQSMS